MLALSYNPGYQNVMKELKQSTRQRFIAIEFAYPDATLETKIVVAESGIDAGHAEKLVRLAQMTRSLKGSGLDEGASTRLLVHAAKLMRLGVAPRTACRGAIAEALTDDHEMLRAVNELASSLF
jgi:nitric oxide reductase NorQ protein